MSTTPSQPVAEESQRERRQTIVNDFSIQVATPNGSGSQSSNNVLMRSIFQMGIPVSGKNLFPSNIQGLPTWFTIRVSKDGYVGRKKEIDILIAMNPQTAREDVENLEPNQVVIYDEPLKLAKIRDDLTFYPVPFTDLAGQVISNVKLKKLVANMVYVGSAAELFGIDMEQVEAAIGKWFEGKPKAVDFNVKAARLGAEYVRDNLEKRDPYQVKSMNATQGKIIIDGNAAAALGCLFAGATVMTWYPITPSSSLCETLIDYLNKYRLDKDGKATFAVIQAEDELAAVGMAIGAGWAGARSMTSTSGPGISLMSEFVGLAYFAEVPCVIFDVQRVGPSTGLPTRTSQGDVSSLYYLSHGDTKHLVLFPASMAECFDFAGRSFDLAERFQQPVFVASDLDLGMNNWMADPFDYPDKPYDRGKVLTAEDLDKVEQFARYRDVDGDGIAYRTLPGNDNPRGAFFTRGSGRNEQARYSERPEDYINQLERLARKHRTARKYVPQPLLEEPEGAQIGIIAYGSTDVAMPECRDQLRQEAGVETAYYRIRALPLCDDLRDFVERYRDIYVVEQNRDGQMADIIRLEVGENSPKVHKIVHFNGLPIDARFISDAILEREKSVGN
ncbi:MAG TPA: 2-oxoacid:acceptor oxidoreductase subunit alpha [Acidobacteriota bacterium]|nr:2-oxoacid:acceptor oxidoreductase subunit alpha [Acidobacteriota bacterium]